MLIVQRKCGIDECFVLVEADVKTQAAAEALHRYVRRRYPTFYQGQVFIAADLNDPPQQLGAASRCWK